MKKFSTITKTNISTIYILSIQINLSQNKTSEREMREITKIQKKKKKLKESAL